MFVRGYIGSVFSVSFSPSGDLACSGGEDDLGVVWKLSTGETVFQSDGKARGRCLVLLAAIIILSLPPSLRSH